MGWLADGVVVRMISSSRFEFRRKAVLNQAAIRPRVNHCKVSDFTKEPKLGPELVPEHVPELVPVFSRYLVCVCALL
jgi:hypothetical protein